MTVDAWFVSGTLLVTTSVLMASGPSYGTCLGLSYFPFSTIRVCIRQHTTTGNTKQKLTVFLYVSLLSSAQGDFLINAVQLLHGNLRILTGGNVHIWIRSPVYWQCTIWFQYCTVSICRINSPTDLRDRRR